MEKVEFQGCTIRNKNENSELYDLETSRGSARIRFTKAHDAERDCLGIEIRCPRCD